MSHLDSYDSRASGLNILSGRFGTTRKVLDGNLVVERRDSPNLVLDPNGADRDVTLPSFVAGGGTFFLISNLSTQFYLHVKANDGTAVETVQPRQMMLFVSSETEWMTGPGLMGAAGPNHRVGQVPDPGAAVSAARFLREDGVWSLLTGAGVLADAFSFVTDGTNTAAGTGADTLKVRSSDGSISPVVTNNDPTHGDSINFTAVPGSINHNLLLNYLADQHVAHSGVDIIAGLGLSGGGNIAASRTLALDLSELSTVAPVLAADFVAFHDASTGLPGKALFSTLNGVLDHDLLLGFVANEHVDHSLVSVVAGMGLSGGGDLTATRTFALDFTELETGEAPTAADLIPFYDVSEGDHNTAPLSAINAALDHNSLLNYNAAEHLSSIADDRIMANISGGAAFPVANTLTAILDSILGTTQGAIIFRDAASWTTLAPGTSGHFLKTQGAAADPIWAAASGSGLPYHTRSALKALTPSSGDHAMLVDGAMSGLFKYVLTATDSTIPAHVTADTLEAVYIPPTGDPTGATGSWIRQRAAPGEILLEWFNISENSDISADLQAAVALAKVRNAALSNANRVARNGSVIKIPAGEYNCNDRVEVDDHGIEIVGRGIGGTIIDISASTTGFLRFQMADFADDNAIERVWVRDMHIRSSDHVFSATDIGIDMWRPKHSGIDRVRISGTSYMVQLWAPGSPFWLTNVEFWQDNASLVDNGQALRVLRMAVNSTVVGADEDPDVGGADPWKYASHGGGCYASNCHFRSAAGLMQTNLYFEAGDGFKFENCHFHLALYGAIFEKKSSVSPIGNVKFYDCHFDLDRADSLKGIWVKPKTYASDDTGYEVKLYNCKIGDCIEEAILLDHDGMRDFAIVGGELKGAGATGFPYIRANGGVRNLEIMGVQFPLGGSAEEAILLDATGATFFAQTNIKGNHFIHAGDTGNLPTQWIRIEDDGSNVGYVGITGNQYAQTAEKSGGAGTTTVSMGLVKLNAVGGTMKVRAEANVCTTAPHSPQAISITTASYTWTKDTDANSVRQTGALTATRNFNVERDRCVNGDRLRIYRSGGSSGGTFGLDVRDDSGAGTLLVTLGQNEWCEVEFDGSAWVLMEFGVSTTPAPGAPTDVDYLVKTSNGSLSAERVVTDSARIAANWGTPGQVTLDIVSQSIDSGHLAANAVTNAKLAQMAQGTIKGRNAGTGTGDPVDLTGAQVLSITGAAPATRNLTAGTGLTGGGDLSADRSFALANIADDRILANISGASAAPVANTLTAILDSILGATQGAIMVRDATSWIKLDPGASGTFLKSNGAAADLAWASPAGSGDVVGPASSVDSRPALFDGTTGKLLKQHGSVLGTAAAADTGTSGTVVPFLDGANTWSATQTIDITGVGVGLAIQSSDDGAGAGPTLQLQRVSTTPAASDNLGRVTYIGRNASAAATTYAMHRAVIVDTTNGAEDGLFEVHTQVAGSLAARLNVAQGIYTTNATGGDKGIDTINAVSFLENGLHLVSFFSVVTYSGGTPTQQSSKNVTSIADTGVGILTVTIATDFTSANWCQQATSEGAGTAATSVSFASTSGKAAGSIVVTTADASATPAIEDPVSISVQGMGARV